MAATPAIGADFSTPTGHGQDTGHPAQGDQILIH
jgi:hypothetical protein